MTEPSQAQQKLNLEKPIDRKMLRDWIESFQPENIEAFKVSLLWRIDDGMFWIPGRYDNRALHNDHTSAEKVLEPTYEEMVEHIRWMQTLWKTGIEIMRKHNIVIDNIDDKMQKLAFTFYSNLCEINSKAEHLFEEG